MRRSPDRRLRSATGPLARSWRRSAGLGAARRPRSSGSGSRPRKVAAWFPPGPTSRSCRPTGSRSWSRPARDRPERPGRPRLLRARHSARWESGLLVGRSELDGRAARRRGPEPGRPRALVARAPRPGAGAGPAPGDRGRPARRSRSSRRARERRARLAAPGPAGLGGPGVRAGPARASTSRRWRSTSRGWSPRRTPGPGSARARPGARPVDLAVRGGPGAGRPPAPRPGRGRPGGRVARPLARRADPGRPRRLARELAGRLDARRVAGRPATPDDRARPRPGPGRRRRAPGRLVPGRAGRAGLAGRDPARRRGGRARRPLTIRAICPAPAEGTWPIPSARPVDATWTGGRTTVRLDPARVLQSCAERSGRRVAARGRATRPTPPTWSSSPTGGPGPVADLTFRKPTADATVEVRGRLRLGDDVPRIEVALTWTVERGRLLAHAADLPPGWTPDRRRLGRRASRSPGMPTPLANGGTRVHLGPAGARRRGPVAHADPRRPRPGRRA